VCGVAQIVVHRLDVKQDLVRISALQPKECPLYERKIDEKQWHQATKPLRESSARTLYLEVNEQLSTFPMIMSINVDKETIFEDHSAADQRTIIQTIIKQWISYTENHRTVDGHWTVIQRISNCTII
jgi:hypothetical protein